MVNWLSRLGYWNSRDSELVQQVVDYSRFKKDGALSQREKNRQRIRINNKADLKQCPGVRSSSVTAVEIRVFDSNEARICNASLWYIERFALLGQHYSQTPADWGAASQDERTNCQQ